MAGLAFIKTRDIAKQDHPPVVGLALFLSADVACKRYIPGHICTPTILPLGYDLWIAANTIAQLFAYRAGKFV